MPKPSSLATALILVTSLANAQTTHIVGPGGFAQIRDALAAATTGDIIHVHPGLYAQFSVTTGVTIRALTPGTVDVAFDQSVLPASCIHFPVCAYANEATSIDIPTGEVAHLIGINFLPSTVVGLGTSIRHHVAIRGGTATLANCHIESYAQQALFVENATAHLTNCIVTGADVALTSRGISTVNATVTASDCQFFGSQVGIGFLPPGEAALLVNSTFQGSSLLLRGGVANNLAGSNAITANDGSVWVCDSALEGGQFSCPIDKTGSLPRLDRVTIIAQSFTCQNVQVSDSLVGISQSQPLQAGQTVHFTLRTAPFGVLALYASTELDHMIAPGFEQPIWLNPNTAFSVTMAVAGFLGHGSASIQIPNSPAVLDQSLWVQAFSTSSWPFAPTLQTSPVVGGVVR